MKALVYHGPGQRAWEEVPDPTIQDPADAIVRIDSTTICGTDLHILKGDVPEVPFATHRFALDETMAAYDTFADAANTRALKVILLAEPTTPSSTPRKKELAGAV